MITWGKIRVYGVDENKWYIVGKTDDDKTIFIHVHPDKIAWDFHESMAIDFLEPHIAQGKISRQYCPDGQILNIVESMVSLFL